MEDVRPDPPIEEDGRALLASGRRSPLAVSRGFVEAGTADVATGEVALPFARAAPLVPFVCEAEAGLAAPPVVTEFVLPLVDRAAPAALSRELPCPSRLPHNVSHLGPTRP